MKVHGSLREGSGMVQGRFMKVSERVHGWFREGSGMVQVSESF